MSKSLKVWVEAAAAREDVCAAVDRVYAEVQREVDLRRPICVASGRCCRFEEFGHRLFVTTLELASLCEARQSLGQPRIDALFQAWDGTGCPFQINRLCGVHAIRPFGCRIFFCDSTSTDWQQEQYEKFHAELKQLHAQLDIAYFYVEWREGLRQIQPDPGSIAEHV